ncbi:hypothetical protein [Neobacillus terrae]|uniref:hypothetical protein n=1 Tax=Neobacillus terrae TaxID=3034837 RepID=UPI00140CA87C|nr:hypothetical protein [Neobacillus terrae]
MDAKLILIEGLPGSGKSTTAKIAKGILAEKGFSAELFLEGDFNHPADYEGAAFLSKEEYASILKEEISDLQGYSSQKEGGWVVHYKKMMEAKLFPKELSEHLSKKDIYELPFKQHVRLITQKWQGFTAKALNEDKIYIFECCFIQNPVTTGMVKHGEANEAVLNYIDELATIIEPLNPLLIYVDQQDIERSFKKAIQERPSEWYEGFNHYYTSQGYGLKNGVHGLEGTLAVLKARKELEKKIFESLNIKKVKLDNSLFNQENHKERLSGILNEALNTPFTLS